MSLRNIVIIFVLLAPVSVLAAPTTNYFFNIAPSLTNTYDNGSSNLWWKNLYAQFASTTVTSGTTFCISSDCRTAWPSSGTGSVGTSTSEVTNQVAVFSTTGATPARIGGSSGFTWDGSMFTVGTIQMTSGAGPTIKSTNNALTLKANFSHVSGIGSILNLQGGDASSLSDTSGGAVYLTGGAGDQGRPDGTVNITQTNTANRVALSVSSITSARTQSFQDSNGIIALTSNLFAYPFPNNATSTGLGIFASTTIGDGNAGLTVSGNATTTGNAVIGNGNTGTTTITVGALGVPTARSCFNSKNTAGDDISFYFVGTTMVVENNVCK